MRWVMGHVVPSGPHVTFVVCVCAHVRGSYIDVVKGIAMFDKLKVPTLALVENMSYFECSEARRRGPVLSVLRPCARR